MLSSSDIHLAGLLIYKSDVSKNMYMELLNTFHPNEISRISIIKIFSDNASYANASVYCSGVCKRNRRLN